MRKRALVAVSLFAFAGCAGASHDDSSRTAIVQKEIAYSAAPGATPFGVMSDASPAPPAASASAPVAVLSPAAAATASASATAVAQSTATATAAAVATSGAAVVPTASPAPLILSVHTSPAVVHDGDTLLWNVRTTSDVVDVVAHVTVYAFRLQKQHTGQYILTFTIPHGVPGFFHGTYTLDLVARSASGAQSSTKVPVSFQ